MNFSYWPAWPARYRCCALWISVSDCRLQSSWEVKDIEVQIFYLEFYLVYLEHISLVMLHPVNVEWAGGADHGEQVGEVSAVLDPRRPAQVLLAQWIIFIRQREDIIFIYRTNFFLLKLIQIWNPSHTMACDKNWNCRFVSNKNLIEPIWLHKSVALHSPITMRQLTFASITSRCWT